MSRQIGNFHSLDLGPGSERLILTAFAGPNNDNQSVQFTVGERYAALRRDQIRRLVRILIDRLGGFTDEN